LDQSFRLDCTGFLCYSYVTEFKLATLAHVHTIFTITRSRMATSVVYADPSQPGATYHTQAIPNVTLVYVSYVFQLGMLFSSAIRLLSSNYVT